jgi:hypothetical protein
VMGRDSYVVVAIFEKGLTINQKILRPLLRIGERCV